MEDKGYIDEATVIKATQTSERQPYDVVRGALKQVDLDSSRRVELDDYVDVSNFPHDVAGERKMCVFANYLADDCHCASSYRKSAAPLLQPNSLRPQVASGASAAQLRAKHQHLRQVIELRVV